MVMSVVSVAARDIEDRLLAALGMDQDNVPHEPNRTSSSQSPTARSSDHSAASKGTCS
jgi:hypothetical protein